MQGMKKFNPCSVFRAFPGVQFPASRELQDDRGVLTKSRNNI
jgi:hypothetical protein